QRARKADAVNETERKRDDPGKTAGQTPFTAQLPDHLDADEYDAQRDAGVERTFRDPDHSERRGRKRYAMSNRERGYGVNQQRAAAHDPDQAQNEQQMVGAE